MLIFLAPEEAEQADYLIDEGHDVRPLLPLSPAETGTFEQRGGITLNMDLVEVVS